MAVCSRPRNVDQLMASAGCPSSTPFAEGGDSDESHEGPQLNYFANFLNCAIC